MSILASLFIRQVETKKNIHIQYRMHARPTDTPQRFQVPLGSGVGIEKMQNDVAHVDREPIFGVEAFDVSMGISFVLLVFVKLLHILHD